MAFEKCDNVECSGCYRVDSTEWHGENYFSGVAYRGDYALLTVPLAEMAPFPEVAVGSALGIFPEWISVAIKVGTGALDEAIDASESDPSAALWVAFETFESEDPKVQHGLLADSVSLLVEGATPASMDEFMNDILVSLTEK